MHNPPHPTGPARGTERFAGRSRAPFPDPRPSSRDLLPRYDAYRRQQVRALLSLLPPEGLRALYGEARASRAADEAVPDPLALLTEFVSRLLPLPPFHVWHDDLRRHPEAHLDEPWMEDALPDGTAPFTLDARVEALQGARWRTDLRVHHTGVGWRGHLAFRRDGEEPTWCTGDIFREADVRSLLGRFREFDRVTLEAFLRSALP